MPRDKRFYNKNYLSNATSIEGISNQRNTKNVHSQRLGVNYTVTLKKYHYIDGQRSSRLRRIIVSTNAEDQPICTQRIFPTTF